MRLAGLTTTGSGEEVRESRDSIGIETSRGSTSVGMTARGLIASVIARVVLLVLDFFFFLILDIVTIFLSVFLSFLIRRLSTPRVLIRRWTLGSFAPKEVGNLST